jgi:hypothetical protein
MVTRSMKRRNQTALRRLGHATAPGDFEMTNKPDPKDTKSPAEPHPGMMGDGTEEQNLGQPGNPDARIKIDEVDAAFAKDPAKKK